MKKRSAIIFAILFLAIKARSQSNSFLNETKTTETETRKMNIEPNGPYSSYYLLGNKKVSGGENKKNGEGFFDKIFIKFYGGYGLLTPGSYSVSSTNGFGWTNPDNIFHDTTVKTQAKKGIGGGLRLGFGIGFIQNDFLNVGIDADYNKGNQLQNSLNTLLDDNNFAKAYDVMNYSAITLTPYVVFKALARPKFFIYNKIGILITLPFTLKTSGYASNGGVYALDHASTYLDSVQYFNSTYTAKSIDSSSYTNKYKISLSLGLNVAFGINFRVTDKMRAFAEIFGNYSALAPSSSVSDNYQKSLLVETVDTTNFHYEKFTKSVTYTRNYTTYNKGGGIGISSYQNQDLGNDSEGYDQTTTTAITNSHKFTVNMAVIGVNVGIIWRFK